MSAFTASVLGLALCAPVLAPVPPEPQPDPFAKAAIGLAADEETLLVTTVYPKMPAGLAGIRMGDKITRVGLVSPHTFKEVVIQVCSYRPGATFEVEIERAGERKSFRLKAVARPPEYDRDRGNYPLPVPPDR